MDNNAWVVGWAAVFSGMYMEINVVVEQLAVAEMLLPMLNIRVQTMAVREHAEIPAADGIARFIVTVFGRCRRQNGVVMVLVALVRTVQTVREIAVLVHHLRRRHAQFHSSMLTLLALAQLKFKPLMFFPRSAG